uniref:Uncharacterized protein n=1 Tax=Globodera rostochiensis TaxID=31243 RepID=A0A914HUY4_GLORO
MRFHYTMHDEEFVFEVSQTRRGILTYTDSQYPLNPQKDGAINEQVKGLAFTEGFLEVISDLSPGFPNRSLVLARSLAHCSASSTKRTRNSTTLSRTAQRLRACWSNVHFPMNFRGTTTTTSVFQNNGVGVALNDQLQHEFICEGSAGAKF